MNLPLLSILRPTRRPAVTRLLGLTLCGLLAACATPGPSGTPASADPVERHSMIRAASAAPDWTQVRERLSSAISAAPGIEISAVGASGLNIQIPVANGFASGRSEIRPSLAAALDVIAPALAAENAVAVQVIGHTDSQGSEMVNLRLSIVRAEAVVEALRQRGVSLDRLTADGRGEADPLTSNATEDGRARNRRVELLLRAMP